MPKVTRAFARSIRPCGRTSGRTVRDREAPGFKSRAPDHFLNTILASRSVLGRAPYHSRITISREVNPEIGSWDTIQIVRA